MDVTTVENISHAFKNKNSIKVIDDFSLTIKSGEVVAILGPSGCGKSTILRCIGGLLIPDKGIISINGNSPQKATKLKKVGFAFQDANLLNWLTVRENIFLPEKVGLKTLSDEKAVKRVDNLIEFVGLKGFENYFTSQLSGGMKQRVALARALLLEPSLLLLDEPFGSLDLLTRSKVVIELNNILKSTNLPTIFVTHSIEEAVYLANRILILSPRPCKVVKEIIPDIQGEKDEDTFEDVKFLTVVSECRKTLLDHWK